jgi:hypothetical protein
MSNVVTVRRRLAKVARTLAHEKREELDLMKSWHDQLARPDFLWHYLLQSFATMGGIAGAVGLIDNKRNYSMVGYNLLAKLWPDARAMQVEQTCRVAGVRWPATKARYILGCFDRIEELGGPRVAKRLLLEQKGRDAKIRFLKTFPGIGDKYARNIMMDVYHEDFHSSIAIDSRILDVSAAWGLSFRSYEEHEDFYLAVARNAKLNGWEPDRLMFNFTKAFMPDGSKT